MPPLFSSYIVEKAIPGGSVRLAGSDGMYAYALRTPGGMLRGVEMEDRGWVWCGGCSERRGRAVLGGWRHCRTAMEIET